MRFDRARMSTEPGRSVVWEGKARRGLEVGVIGCGMRAVGIAREEARGGMVVIVRLEACGVGFTSS
jgi:hypothetical protein